MILALGFVPADKIDRVYGQIQRLMQETQGRIQLTRFHAAGWLIRHLSDFTSEDQEIAFTNDLIERVNGVQGHVDDDILLTHIYSAWTRVRGATQTELQELARQDKDYMQVIADVTDARRDRQLQNAKDIEALEKFKADFAALKDKTDEKFETEAATLLGGLPETAKETAGVFIESARKSRSIARFSAELQILKYLTSDELQTQGMALLKNYPEKYCNHLKNFVLRLAVQQKRSQEADGSEDVKAAGTTNGGDARSSEPESESTPPAALPRPGLVSSNSAGRPAGSSSGEATDPHAEGLGRDLKRLKLSPSTSQESLMDIEE